MKKLIISAICSAIAASGFAQGTVNFQNGVTTGIFIDVGTNAPAKVTSGTIASMTGAATGPGASTGVIDVGLFWGTSASSVLANTGGVVGIGGSLGQLAGNTIFSLGNTTTPGETVFIDVWAWDSAFGNTLAGAQAAMANGGYFGAFSGGSANGTYGAVGAPLQIVLGATGGPGTALFGTAGNVFTRDQLLVPVPEPATLALGGLGAAALLFLRRRK